MRDRRGGAAWSPQTTSRACQHEHACRSDHVEETSKAGAGGADGRVACGVIRGRGVNRVEVGEDHLVLAVEDREDDVVARPGRF